MNHDDHKNKSWFEQKISIFTMEHQMSSNAHTQTHTASSHFVPLAYTQRQNSEAIINKMYLPTARAWQKIWRRFVVFIRNFHIDRHKNIAGFSIHFLLLLVLFFSSKFGWYFCRSLFNKCSLSCLVAFEHRKFANNGMERWILIGFVPQF